MNGFLKRSSSQVDHLNNLNSLKDVDERYNYPNKLRPSSEDRDLNDDVDSAKKLNGKLSSRPSHRSTPVLPIIRITPEYEAPLKTTTHHRVESGRPSVSRLESDTMPRQAPPPRPDRAPGQYRPLQRLQLHRPERTPTASDTRTRSRRAAGGSSTR